MHYQEVHNLKEKCKFNSEDLILKNGNKSL